MTHFFETPRRRGRPHRLGSARAAAADRKRRREAYADLRKRLGMSSLELADLLGQSVATVRTAPFWASPRAAPTDATLTKMRRELVRRTRARVEEARLKREIERELLEAECEEHLRVCGIFDPDAIEADDMEDAA
jgi:hypothetical protein